MMYMYYSASQGEGSDNKMLMMINMPDWENHKDKEKRQSIKELGN